MVSKTRRDREPTPASPPASDTPEFPSPRATRIATLVGLLAVAAIGGMSWEQGRRLQRSLDERLGRIDDRLTRLASRVESGAAAPARRGPDPDKAYAVKTDGSPVRGPANAAITIAEFSDFQ